VAQRWIDHVEQRSDELESPQVLQVGGSRLPEELARKVRPVLGCTLQHVFGMAEGLLNYTRLDDPEDVVVATQGRPVSPADEVLLVDAADRPVPPGELGSLLTTHPGSVHALRLLPCHRAQRPVLHRRGLVPPRRHLPVASQRATWSSRAATRT
jgi:non-ribosomal peptide synthetase component E (peptide arylation enzyme)